MHKNPNTPNALTGNPQRPRAIPNFDRDRFITLMNAASMPKDRFLDPR